MRKANVLFPLQKTRPDLITQAGKRVSLLPQEPVGDFERSAIRGERSKLR